MEKTNLEKVKLFEVYSKDGKLHATDTADVERIFELYGFLKVVIKNMEEGLIRTLRPYDGDEDERRGNYL